jgi:hypothetical protein
MESSWVARDAGTMERQWTAADPLGLGCLFDAARALTPVLSHPPKERERAPLEEEWADGEIVHDRRGCTNCARKPGACSAPDISRAQTWTAAFAPAPGPILHNLRAQPIYTRRACARKCRSCDCSSIVDVRTEGRGAVCKVRNQSVHRQDEAACEWRRGHCAFARAAWYCGWWSGLTPRYSRVWSTTSRTTGPAIAPPKWPRERSGSSMTHSTTMRGSS